MGNGKDTVLRFVVSGALLGSPLAVGCGSDEEPHDYVNEPAPPPEEVIATNEPAPVDPAPLPTVNPAPPDVDEEPEPDVDDRPTPNTPARRDPLPPG